MLSGTSALYIIVLGLNAGEMVMPLSVKPVVAVSFASLEALADARVITKK